MDKHGERFDLLSMSAFSFICLDKHALWCALFNNKLSGKVFLFISRRRAFNDTSTFYYSFYPLLSLFCLNLTFSLK